MKTIHRRWIRTLIEMKLHKFHFSSNRKKFETSSLCFYYNLFAQREQNWQVVNGKSMTYTFFSLLISSPISPYISQNLWFDVCYAFPCNNKWFFIQIFFNIIFDYLWINVTLREKIEDNCKNFIRGKTIFHYLTKSCLPFVMNCKRSETWARFYLLFNIRGKAQKNGALIWTLFEIKTKIFDE